MIILNEFSSIEGPKLYRENIYVGAVMIKRPIPLVTRKILFQTTHDEYGTYNNDLLYDSPNYRVLRYVTPMDYIFIGHTVNITPALEKHGFPYELTDDDIRKIYKWFLHPNSDFLKCEYVSSPISKSNFEILRKLSNLKKHPSKFEKREYPDKFKTKVKTYTFK